MNYAYIMCIFSMIFCHGFSLGFILQQLVQKSAQIRFQPPEEDIRLILKRSIISSYIVVIVSKNVLCLTVFNI